MKDENATFRRGAVSAPAPAREPRRYTRQLIEVAAIEDAWRVDEEWWREKPVSRLYFEVLLADGRRLIVFKEMLEGEWYRQKF